MRLNKVTQTYIKNKANGYLSKDQKSEDLNQYLRLDLGENLLGYPEVKSLLHSVDEETLRYYADPSNTDIKNVIAKLYGVLPRNVSIANSINEAIDTIPRMILSKPDRSIVITPTFFRIVESSMQNRAKIIHIRLSEENGFKPTSDLVDKVCKVSKKNNVSIIWICNPNNPTGEVWELDKIEKIVRTSNSLVVVDEAFYELYDPNNIHSAIKLINKYHNVIVLRSLSKAYGLAGLRFGYILSHPDIIEVIENYRDTLLMTSRLIIAVAGKVLANQQFIHQTAQETRLQKEKLFKEIRKLKNLHIGADTKTNIYLLKHLKKDLYQELLVHGIRTADFRQANSIEGKGYIRVTIANDEKNMKLLKALKEVNKYE